MNKASEPGVNSIRISENVISKIAEAAVSGVEGVRGSAVQKNGIAAIFSKPSKQPVSIRMNGGSAEISVNIVVSDACRVKSAAEKIQERVKEDVQNMTGIAVTKVSVYVMDIVFENE